MFIYKMVMEIPPGVRTLLWEYSLDEAPAGKGWEKVIIEWDSVKADFVGWATGLVTSDGF